MTWDYPYPPPPPAPQPKKNKVGKILGIGCGGILAVALVGGCMAAIVSSGSGHKGTKASTTHTTTAPAGKTTPSAAKPKQAAPKAKAKTVTFKVWGTAPAGALGAIDITYGSDSDNLQGHFKNGSFTATLPLDKKAMYYNVDAQLQGSGDIHCSITVGSKTATAHAAGGYNICNAQLSAGLFGGWE